MDHIKRTLNLDMATLSSYLQKWQLKLSKTKTVSTAFHFKNKEAKRELNIIFEGNSLPCNSTSIFLGVTQDRTLTYRHHLQTLRQKLTSHIALIRRQCCQIKMFKNPKLEFRKFLKYLFFEKNPKF